METFESVTTCMESPEPVDAGAGRAVLRRPAGTRELLAEFSATGSQGCFEEIVRRYGAMVLHVCQEVTRDRHDAEDATQTAFFTLAERLRAGETIHSLGSWLQQVARRAALDIRRSRKRRGKRERDKAVPESAEAPGPENFDGGDLARQIREELDKVPIKYRVPLVLHYFGGMDYAETAKELGIKPATLGVRLFRGRKLLGERLARRGVTLSAAALATLLARVVRESLSHALTRSAAQAAVAGNGAGPLLAAAPPALFGQGLGALLLSTKVKLLLAAGLVVLAAAGAGAAVRALPDLPPLLDLRRLRPHVPTLRSNVRSPRADSGEKPDREKPRSPADPIVIRALPGVPEREAKTHAAGGAAPMAGGSVPSTGVTPPRLGGAGAAGAAPAAPHPLVALAPSPLFPSGPAATHGGGAASPAVGAAPGVGRHGVSPTPARGPTLALSTPNVPNVPHVPNVPAGASPLSGSFPTAVFSGTNPASPPGGAAAPGGAIGPATPAAPAGPVYTAASAFTPPAGTIHGTVASAPTFLWSVDGAGADLTALDSVRLTLYGTRSTPSPALAFLAATDPTVPALPSGRTFVGVWGIRSDQPFGAVDLTVRYDDKALQGVGGDPSHLTLWGYDGQWKMLNVPGANVDANQYLIWGQADGIQFFAVSTPEPTALALAAAAGGLLMTRRRRRRRRG